MKDVLLILDHLDGGEPSNCIAFGVSVFKGLFNKLCYEILKACEGKGGRGRGDGKLSEGGCSCGCRSFGHTYMRGQKQFASHQCHR